MSAVNVARLPAMVAIALAIASCHTGTQAPEAVHLVLYEGLPHQTQEWELYEAKRGSKPVRELGEYPFYEEPLYLGPGDAELLKETGW